MIAYKGIKKTYVSSEEKLNKLIDYLTNSNFYYVSKEELEELISLFVSFCDNFTRVEKEEILERKETEEEAKAYFGEEFIAFYSTLLKRMDDSNKVIALHGTNTDIAQMIMEGGLKYNSPALGSTALMQTMPFGSDSFAVQNYSELLNWPHRGYKTLVMLAIPYECLYKSGLWHHDGGNSPYEMGYRISEDFVLGYIDVVNKTFVMNPKYRSVHDFTSLVFDMDIYKPNSSMTNEMVKSSYQKAISSEERLDLHPQDPSLESPPFTEDMINIDESNVVRTLLEAKDDLIGNLRSISYGDGGISEEYYQKVMRDFQRIMIIFKKCQALVPSKEELTKKMQESKVSTVSLENDESWDWDWEWEDDTSRKA